MLIVVGAAFPESIIMSSIGFLLGSNVISLDSTFFAIADDYASYFIGIYFQDCVHGI